MKTIKLLPLERFWLRQAMLNPERRTTFETAHKLNRVLIVLDFSEEDREACGWNDIMTETPMGDRPSGVIFHKDKYMFTLEFEDADFNFMLAEAQAFDRWPRQSSEMIEALGERLEEAKSGTTKED